MVSKTNLDGKRVYKCGKCGWLYEERIIAEKCQKWCEKHKSCNLNYQKYAMKIGSTEKNPVAMMNSNR